MSQPEQAAPSYAFFDFDGTITQGDSFIPFLRYHLGTGPFLGHLLRLAPVFIGYGLKLIPNDRAKEKVLLATIAGRTPRELQEAARAYWPRLEKALLPAGLEKLREQQAAGRRCVLVSASPELFLRPWAEALGFSHVIATQLEEADGRCTGRLGSANCYGAEKVRRIEAQLGPGAWTDSWAFGDSRADLPMLRASGRGFLRRGEHFDPVS